MFVGFNLLIDEKANYLITNYYRAGLDVKSKNKGELINMFNSCINVDDGSIDGSKVQEDWFGEVKCDIFISHSHKDEKLAISIAGWLNKEFGLRSFVDSTIWGYSNDLLKLINDKYNLIDKDEKEITYKYNGANFAASHVHMMLCCALNNMIDKSECIFFINTANSMISLADEDKTNSPWIYYEIVIANSIRKKCNRLFENVRSIEKREMYQCSNLNIQYKIDLSTFKILNSELLMKWLYDKSLDENPLDTLYKMTKILTPIKYLGE